MRTRYSPTPSGEPLLPETERRLAELLERETGELAEFITTLEAELDSLATGTPHAIDDCSTAKQRLIRSIFASRDAVNALARSHSRNSRATSPEAWLASLESSVVRRAFERLIEHAGRARELNQLAGRLLHIKQCAVNERLDVLRPSGWMEALYQPGGHTGIQMSPKGVIGRA